MNSKKKKRSTTASGGVAFLKFLAFVFPLFLYLLMVLWIFPAPNSGFIALGILGCVILGLAFVNIVGLLDDMYIGRYITAICGIVGSVLVSISVLVMYIPGIYSQLNESHISFYFVIWAMLIVSLIYYIFFRHAITLHLQENGKSKTYIKKAMKGTKNYWWYNNLKKDLGYPWIFGVNKLFGILYPLVCIVHLFFGWWQIIVLGVTVFTIILLVLNLLMYSLVFLTWGYGHVDKRRKSPLVMVGGFAFPIAGCIGLINYLPIILE